MNSSAAVALLFFFLAALVAAYLYWKQQSENAAKKKAIDEQNKSLAERTKRQKSPDEDSTPPSASTASTSSTTSTSTVKTGGDKKSPAADDADDEKKAADDEKKAADDEKKAADDEKKAADEAKKAEEVRKQEGGSLRNEWKSSEAGRPKPDNTNPMVKIVKDLVVSEAINMAVRGGARALWKGGRYVAKKGIKAAAKAAVKKAGKALAKLSAKGLKQAAKSLMKVGTKALAKMGFKTGAAVAGRAAAKAAAKAVGKSAAKMAAKAAAAAASKAMAKGGPTPVGAALMVFDLMSMTLDILDVGGYGRMKTNNDLLQNRDMVDRSFEAQMTEAGNQLPIFTSPLDKLDAIDSLKYYKEDEMDKRKFIANGGKEADFKPRNRDNEESTQDKEMEKISTAWLTTPNSWLFQTILAKTNKKRENFEDEDEMKEWVKDNVDAVPDMELQNRLKSALCTQRGGKVMEDKYKDGTVIPVCTYRDADSCDRSFTWPMKEDPTNFDIYAEWDQSLDKGKGACVMRSPAFREQCEKAKSKTKRDAQGNFNKMFRYNPRERSCRVTEHYCRAKGVDMVNGDCKVKAGQQVAEAVFGTTITRGLRQVFEMSQYKPCNRDETDMGYFCMKKCPPGYTDMGLMCLQKCQPGWSDDGLFCRDPIKKPVSKSLEWRQPCGGEYTQR